MLFIARMNVLVAVQKRDEGYMLVLKKMKKTEN